MQLLSLIRDPVVQLNLLLWMAKEQPASHYIVRPFWSEYGFRLIYIEHPFRFPHESIQAIQASGLEISREPEPEIILGRGYDQRALYFEAKADSFSSTSSTAKQARGHLLATGSAFAEVLAPLKSALLCYVVPEDRRTLMAECLAELSVEMHAKTLDVGPTSVHGLAIRENALTYTLDEAMRTFSGIAETTVEIMSDLAEDTDPSPLFLVYSVEDYPDPERQNLLRRALLNQVHAHLLCALNAHPPNTEYATTGESLLVELTDHVFEKIGRKRQKQMKDSFEPMSFVFSPIRRRAGSMTSFPSIREHCALSSPIRNGNATFSIGSRTSGSVPFLPKDSTGNWDCLATTTRKRRNKHRANGGRTVRERHRMNHGTFASRLCPAAEGSTIRHCEHRQFEPLSRRDPLPHRVGRHIAGESATSASSGFACSPDAARSPCRRFRRNRSVAS